jgi:glutamate formiminotransferase
MGDVAKIKMTSVYDKGWNDAIRYAVNIVEAEPELVGPAPRELLSVSMEEALRATVRATKKSIAKAIRDLEAR